MLTTILIIFILYKIIQRILKIPQISNLDSRYILITGCDTGFGNAIVTVWPMYFIESSIVYT